MRNRGKPAVARIHRAVGPWEYTDYHSVDRRIERVVQHLGIDKNRITAVDHHRCHATYAFLASSLRNHALVMVADQVGDFVNASVWRTDTGGDLVGIDRSYALNSIGRIYSVVTGILGMRPLEDEHKVMGLAPHASFENAARYMTAFEKLIRVEGMGFVESRPAQPCWKTLPRSLRGARFDDLAGAVQLFLEKRMTEWVKAATRETGLDSVVLSGGVALNVKANRVIGLLPSVRALEVPPAGGDESLAIGAAQAVSLDAGVRPESIPPLGLPYLGDEFCEASLRHACETLCHDERFRILEIEDRVGYVAQRLAQGCMVGRFAGRMEFGPRALGNRSILADASDLAVTNRLNRRVKHRDFWMPFAPAILAERAGCYFDNPKVHDASTMTIAFPSTSRAKREIPAALHSADGTLRPQTVDERNHGFHQILKRFEALTGRVGLLNTSFNRHREPIVHTPEDAVRTFATCDLDLLDLNYFLVERVPNDDNA
jgi:carbamoyltransferase